MAGSEEEVGLKIFTFYIRLYEAGYVEIVNHNGQVKLRIDDSGIQIETGSQTVQVEGDVHVTGDVYAGNFINT